MSPLYFVSFVLTAQFVLINVVVAVLMKHLDDSNKEAQEDAEMDAELELEMAQGLGPGPRLPAGGPGVPGGGGDAEGHLCPHCYSPAQVGRGWGRRGRHLGAARDAARGAWGRDFCLLGTPCSAPSDPVMRGRARPQVQRAEGSGAPPTPQAPPVIIPPVPTRPVRLGEPVAGQRLFNHQGLLGGGADHHRQPVRVRLPPLLLPGRLQELP